MGRYVNSGARVGIPDESQALVRGRIYPRIIQSNAVYSYDVNECWPNKILIEDPGSYTFTIPSGATCMRAVLVGGGGKFGCKPTTTTLYGGAGGAYAEKFFNATAGTNISLIIGKQQETTTLSYPTNSLTVTAGGATFCTPGTASGGDWNSTGGAAGLACGPFNACSTCYITSAVSCCGYCVVVGCMPGYSDSGIQQCCALHIPGGGSAGSFVWSTGGAGGTVCEVGNGYTASGVGGGGGGIGTISRCNWCGVGCNCICYNGIMGWSSCYMGSAQGGGGTKWHGAVCPADFSFQTGYNGNICQNMALFGGIGHPGGHDKQEGLPEYFYQFYQPCCSCKFWPMYIPQGPDPKKYSWHDVYDINGTGGAGRSLAWTTATGTGNDGSGGCGRSYSFARVFHNAGEGAGTGAIYYSNCCSNVFTDINSYAPFFVDWQMICCIGSSGRLSEAKSLRQEWFLSSLGCAGTLGGSGAVNLCNFATMAGAGGGAGGFKRFIVCVCHGGAFNCCNQAANTPLAFPPACLDTLISNAGPGLAILYWK